MNKAIIIFLLIVLIAFFGYKYLNQEALNDAHPGDILAGDVCSKQFAIDEELRVSLSNTQRFERWYLTKDGTLRIMQGSVVGGAAYRVENVMSRKFSEAELGPLRKLFNSQSFKDIKSGIYQPNSTTNDRVLCNPKDQGWYWTYMTLDRCTTVMCRGRKPITDAIQDEVLRLSRMIPGYRCVKG